MFWHCVPFPEPGAPKTNTTLGLSVVILAAGEEESSSWRVLSCRKLLTTHIKLIILMVLWWLKKKGRLVALDGLATKERHVFSRAVVGATFWTAERRSADVFAIHCWRRHTLTANVWCTEVVGGRDGLACLSFQVSLSYDLWAFFPHFLSSVSALGRKCRLQT